MQLFPEIRNKKTKIPNLFYNFSIILIPNSTNDTTRKLQSKISHETDTEIFNKTLTNQI